NVGTVTFVVKNGSNVQIGSPVVANVSAGSASGPFAIPSGTAVGSYTITASYSGGTGYNASSGTANLTVSKATLTVTADPASRAYGAANPTFTASYSGFKNGQTLATSGVTGSPGLSTTATATSSVAGNPYAITTTIGTLASGNYSFSLVNGSLTI